MELARERCFSEEGSLCEMGDDRPFVCTAPGCGQRFTNEDHLSVHKHKHEMTLKFGPARTDSVIIADQTPTPTRFLKNCEEVGLFNELATSFEQEFPKAQEEDDKRPKNPGLIFPTQLPAPQPSTLQTPSEVKEEEEPLEVDSSPPGSPDSASSMSDSSKEAVVRGKETPPRPAVSSAPTPTIVRPGSLPLSLGYDPLQPTLPSPTSVITQTPPSNRQLSSPSGPYPLVMHLPNGHALPLLPSPVQMTSVISLARPCMVPNVPGIPGPPVGGSSSGSSSPSAYSLHSEARMRLKAVLSQQAMGAQSGPGGAVPQRQEQSQQLTQHSDTPSPAQPQVSPAQPTGGRRRRASEADPDERRQRFLERNRAAASRCRQKRKVWVSSLERKAEDLVSMNVSLTNEVSLLRSEVTQLKQLLLAHKDCPVTALQKKAAYLATGGEEASRGPSGPTGSPAPVIRHAPPSPGAVANGLNVRAAEAVAMSVLAGMGAGQPGRPASSSHMAMAAQSQPAPS